MTNFENLSNELILCVWDYLHRVDIIFGFANLNERITPLPSRIRWHVQGTESALHFRCQRVYSSLAM